MKKQNRGLDRYNVLDINAYKFESSVYRVHNFLTYPMQVPKSPRPRAGGSSLPFVFCVLYYILHRNSHRIVDNVELLWHLCGLLDMDRMV